MDIEEIERSPTLIVLTNDEWKCIWSVSGPETQIILSYVSMTFYKLNTPYRIGIVDDDGCYYPCPSDFSRYLAFYSSLYANERLMQWYIDQKYKIKSKMASSWFRCSKTNPLRTLILMCENIDVIGVRLIRQITYNGFLDLLKWCVDPIRCTMDTFFGLDPLGNYTLCRYAIMSKHFEVANWILDNLDKPGAWDVTDKLMYQDATNQFPFDPKTTSKERENYVD